MSDKNLAAFLAVGFCAEESPGNIHAEINSDESNTWTTLQDYPYAGMRSFRVFYDFHLILILIKENGLGLYTSAYHEVE